MQFVNSFLISILLCSSLAAQKSDEVVAENSELPLGEKVEPIHYQNFYELLNAFARVKTFSADFHEEKHVELLLEPLQSHGKVHFHALGARLSRHTSSPFASILVVAAKWVRVYENSVWEEVGTDRHPVIMQIVSGFMSILLGDYKGLEEIYEVEFSPGIKKEQGWDISLNPRVSPIDKIIASIKVSGHGLLVERMEVVEVSGDVTVTIFSSQVLDEVHTKKELETLFPFPGNHKDNE